MLPGCEAAGWVDVVSVSLTGLEGEAKQASLWHRLHRLSRDFHGKKYFMRFARSAKVLFSVKIPA
jgi:hypothetical protein